MSRLTRVALTLLAAALTASCTLGPNYKRPVVETPAVHRGATPGTAGPESLADLKWFELFHDDQLTALVSTALKENFEVRIAAERVLQARAAYGITRADQFPSVGVSVDAIAARYIEERREQVHSGECRHQRELYGGRIHAWLGARRVGTAATLERSGPCAISRHGRGPPRCPDDARRGCDANVSVASRARLRARDRHANPRCGHQQHAAHRRTADGRRGERAGRAPGRAAAVHGDGTDCRVSSGRSRRPRTR